MYQDFFPPAVETGFVFMLLTSFLSSLFEKNQGTLKEKSRFRKWMGATRTTWHEIMTRDCKTVLFDRLKDTYLCIFSCELL